MKKCNHCGQDPESPRTGKPLISFDGTLQEIHLRKVVDGTPPLYIYDAVFDVTGEHPLIPVQIMRHGESSLPGKLGQTFRIEGATLRFEHGEPPPVSAQRLFEELRQVAMGRRNRIYFDSDEDGGRRRATEIMHFLTSMQIQLAQTRMVIQVSDVKEAG